MRVIIALMIFHGTLAWGASTALRGLPHFHYDLPAFTLHQFVLGSACLSLPAPRLDLNCNPALLASEEKRVLRANIVLDDRADQVNEYREKMTDEDTIGIINLILEQREPLIARAASAIWYQHDWWAVGWTPMRIGFGSVVRNPAYPEIAAHIYKEMEFFGKAGLVFADDPRFQVGLQTRYVRREFFRDDFSLLDVLAGSKRLSVEKQDTLYLEPGLSYLFDTAWPTSVSVVLTQVPVYRGGAKDPVQPVLDLGLSTAPTFAGGKWRTTTHFTNRQDEPDFFKSFRWGTLYEFIPELSASMSIGKNAFAAGLNGNIDSLVLGLGYKTELLKIDQWEETRISTTMFEAGLAF